MSNKTHQRMEVPWEGRCMMVHRVVFGSENGAGCSP